MVITRQTSSTSDIRILSSHRTAFDVWVGMESIERCNVKPAVFSDTWLETEIKFYLLLVDYVDIIILSQSN